MICGLKHGGTRTRRFGGNLQASIEFNILDKIWCEHYKKYCLGKCLFLREQMNA